MFSVVIPLYNKGQLVQRAINSASNQSFEGDWEIVVVDDGSTDDSAIFVKEYNDIRVKYFYKQNGGVSSARNFGVGKAKGEWIVFLDADDELMPCALSTFEELASTYPTIPVLVGQSEWIVNGKKKEITEPLRNNIISRTNAPHFSMWKRTFYPAPRNMAVKREIIEKLGGFDERMSYYEDTEFSLRMLRCGSTAYTNKVVAKYIQDGQGLSASRHPIEKEFAYYIPELIAKASFWEKALLYENLELTILAWGNNSQSVAKYRKMQQDLFPFYYRFLHWIRQKMVRHHLI